VWTLQKGSRNKVGTVQPSKIDNAQNISASVSFCRNCERFLSPPQSWTLAKPESSELLAICLKKLKGLNKVRLTEAHFIWTEPHSKRLRVSMTIQKEVGIFAFRIRKTSNSLSLDLGSYKHNPRADVRDRIPCTTWPMSRLRKTCRKEYLESTRTSETEGPT